MSLVLHPLTLTEAAAFVRRHHRHHKPGPGGLFAIGCAVSGSDEPCGVVIVGRPVARMLDNGWTCEVTRLATDGSKNACSLLYAAAARAAFAMGYRCIGTYILETEPGTSVRAAGWREIGSRGGGSWNCISRPRVDKHPTIGKLRFEKTSGHSPGRGKP